MRESGPEYVTGAVHEAMPEKELPLKEAVTGWLYQPFASGRAVRAPAIVGVEVSKWRAGTCGWSSVRPKSRSHTDRAPFVSTE